MPNWSSKPSAVVSLRGHHDPGVVDQQVELVVPELVGEGAHRVEAGEVERATSRSASGTAAGISVAAALALRRAAQASHHMRAVAGELARGLEPETAVAARDHRHAAALVGDLVGVPLAHGDTSDFRLKLKAQTLDRLAHRCGVKAAPRSVDTARRGRGCVPRENISS